MSSHEINCHYFSQEDLLEAGCLDIRLAMDAAESAMKAFAAGDVLFPEKIVQIFNDDTQERINCLPATFLKEKVCGMKWVSVFPPNPVKYGLQNLSAVLILSEIEHGFPIAVMEGTLCSNMRVGAMGALAARHLAREDASSIGFIGAGEQAKMHLIAMKAARPGLKELPGRRQDSRGGGGVRPPDVADPSRHRTSVAPAATWRKRSVMQTSSSPRPAPRLR